MHKRCNLSRRVTTVDKSTIKMAKLFLEQAKRRSAKAQEFIDELKEREKKYDERREQYRKSSKSSL